MFGIVLAFLLAFFGTLFLLFSVTTRKHNKLRTYAGAGTLLAIFFLCIFMLVSKEIPIKYSEEYELSSSTEITAVSVNDMPIYIMADDDTYYYFHAELKTIPVPLPADSCTVIADNTSTPRVEVYVTKSINDFWHYAAATNTKYVIYVPDGTVS